jgi:hypothetical protein
MRIDRIPIRLSQVGAIEQKCERKIPSKGETKKLQSKTGQQREDYKRSWKLQ